MPHTAELFHADGSPLSEKYVDMPENAPSAGTRSPFLPIVSGITRETSLLPTAHSGGKDRRMESTGQSHYRPSLGKRGCGSGR